MTNRLPLVTSVFFITLIKAYLQGTKTKNEIKQEVDGLFDWEEITSRYATQDVTFLLTRAAQNINENYYADIVEHISSTSDTIPTRAGLIHHLEQLLKGNIDQEDLYEWATWHNVDSDDDATAVFEDLAVAYFCLYLLPAQKQHLTEKKYQQALYIFRQKNSNMLKDKIALVLLIEKERQYFSFFLRDYLQGTKSIDELDVYLLNKFGMDHHSFPYMEALASSNTHHHNQDEMTVLLKKAAMEK
ncbi:hypothetical protein [Chitinophaga defluvii]|uniref:Uncharacterized protein n=1 Tax=Chitinophaga defluvii TaxID=3163343 RepID=A0ABV2T5K3_9BACT